MLTPAELIVSFKKNFYNQYVAMRDLDHGYDRDNPSPYHVEGTVWEHTLATMTHAIEQEETHPLLPLCMLLHDIGKPASVKSDHEKKRAYMYGHAGISAYMAMGVMDRFGYSESDKRLLFRAIAQHQIFYTGKRDMNGVFAIQDLCDNYLSFLLSQCECDIRGRVADQSVSSNRHSLNHMHAAVSDSRCAHPKLDFNKPDCYVLVGPPCSGKSTYVSDFNADRDRCVVSRDDILMEAAPDGMTYNEAWNVMDHRAVDEMLMKKFHRVRKEGCNMYVDMTNMSAKSRRKWVSAVCDTHNVHMIVFATPFDTIHERNWSRHSSDDKFIPVNAILDMLGSFSFPTWNEADSIEIVL